MGFQLKLFSFWVCLLLTLSFCHGKNVTVKVFGLMHCRECIRHDFSSSQESMGINVSISCKSRNRETKPQGNGAVDSEGKFYVALSAEITKHGNPLDGCVAKLQSAAAAPCPIQSAQTASVKLLATEENATEAAYNRPTTIQFSPVTCQSAIFWPLPNFTFFPGVSPPTREPMGFAPPPSEALPPLATSIQPPAPTSPPSYLPPIPSLPPPPPKFGDPSPPPDVNLGTPPPAPASPPSYLPPIPSLPPPPSEFGDPSPPPDVNFGTPPPAPASWSQSPQNKPNPTSKGTSRPPIPVYETPLLPPQVQPSNAPIPSPTPKSRKPIRPPFSEHPLQKPPPPASPFYQTPYPSPPPVLPAIPPPHGEPHPKTPNAPPPNPQLGKPTPTSPAGSLNPPDQGNPNPIPRAPPVPQLPPIPTVPRKYFNAPKSKSQPPRSSYSSHP